MIVYTTRHSPFAIRDVTSIYTKGPMTIQYVRANTMKIAATNLDHTPVLNRKKYSTPSSLYHVRVSHQCMQLRCKFLLRTERTSVVNLRASSTGSRLRRAVSCGSENQDLIGIALSVGGDEGELCTIRIKSSPPIITLQCQAVSTGKQHQTCCQCLCECAVVSVHVSVQYAMNSLLQFFILQHVHIENCY